MTIPTPYVDTGAQAVHMTEINNTGDDLRSNLGICQIAIESDTGKLGYKGADGVYRSIRPDGWSNNSSGWLDPIISFFDNTTGLPTEPITGDRYVAMYTAHGWTQNEVEEYNGAEWVNTVPVIGAMLYNNFDQFRYRWLGMVWISINFDNIGKILATEGDAHSDYLCNKLITQTGTGLYMENVGGGGNNTLQILIQIDGVTTDIDATNHLFVINPHVTNVKVATYGLNALTDRTVLTDDTALQDNALLNLPAIATCIHKEYVIHFVHASASFSFIITPNGQETFEGTALSLDILDWAIIGTITIQNDGVSDWKVINKTIISNVS